MQEERDRFHVTFGSSLAPLVNEFELRVSCCSMDGMDALLGELVRIDRNLREEASNQAAEPTTPVAEQAQALPSVAADVDPGGIISSLEASLSSRDDPPFKGPPPPPPWKGPPPAAASPKPDTPPPSKAPPPPAAPTAHKHLPPPPLPPKRLKKDHDAAGGRSSASGKEDCSSFWR